MNLNSIDLNKLAVFSRIVEAGNYRKASEALHVTPSALSQTIASLEHSLGIPLFHRVGKKLVLTDSGARIQREFQLHHSQFSHALARIAGKERQVSGLIRVGAYLEFAKFQLSPVLAAFLKRHPEVQVKLAFDTPSRLHRMLEAGKLDLCFSIYPERGNKRIESRPIYHEELLLVAPKGMLEARPTCAQVMAAPMIEYYFNHQPLKRWLALHFNRKPKRLPIRAFGASAEMVLALIQENLGAGIVPEYLLKGKTLKSLVICRPTPRKLMDHIWMLQLKGADKPLALQRFAKAIGGIDPLRQNE